MRPPVALSIFEQFARGWRGVALVALVALASSVLGLDSLPLFDSDEARFALVSRDLADGQAPRDLTALGAHWAQAGVAQALAPTPADAIWPYRLPSVLGIVIATLAAYWAGAALVGRRAALLGAGLFAAGIMAGFLGMLATADALTLGCFTLAMAALARLRRAREPWAATVFWAALAAAAIIEGVVPALLAALALALLFVWERRAAWMRPLVHWSGPAAAFAMLMLSAWGLGGLGGAWFGAFAERYSPSDGLPTPPGYHLFLLPLLIFPATYALPAAARLSWAAFRAAPDDADHAAIRFLIAWALPAFLLFEPALSKTPSDALPAYPAIALLCGAGLMAMRRRNWRTAPPAGLVMFAVCGLALAGLMALAATFIPGDLTANVRRAIATALVAAVVVALAVAALLAVRHPAARAAALIACALALSFSAREQLLPQARTLFVSSEAVAAMTRARLSPPEGRPLWVAGYDEPSLKFLVAAAQFVSVERAAADAHAGDAMVVEGRVLARLEAGLAARGLGFAPAEPPARGFALGRGERVALFVGEVSATGGSAGDPPRNP